MGGPATELKKGGQEVGEEPGDSSVLATLGHVN